MIRTLVTAFLFFALSAEAQDNSLVNTDSLGQALQIGIIADCQYANEPTKGLRHYRLSTRKLSESVAALNTFGLDHVFHLGDLIDQHMHSYDSILPVIQRLEAPHTLVLGNHDFSVADSLKQGIPEYLGLSDRYFSTVVDNWRFIILDGNDVSLYAWPEGSSNEQIATQVYQQQYQDRETWNGAIGQSQLEWLKKQLDQADVNGEKVILLCHFPVLPVDSHVLWNHQEVLELVTGYTCVKAWFNGHNHAGAYINYYDIHFITFKGMVDTEETSYATVTLEESQLVIKGFGREKDRVLEIK